MPMNRCRFQIATVPPDIVCLSFLCLQFFLLNAGYLEKLDSYRSKNHQRSDRDQQWSHHSIQSPSTSMCIFTVFPSTGKMHKAEVVWVCTKDVHVCIPRPSMCGIFTHIYQRKQPYARKYTTRGWYGHVWDMFAHVFSWLRSHSLLSHHRCPFFLAETVAAIFPTASFQTTKTAQFNATNFRQRDQPHPFRRHGWKVGKCSTLQTRAGDNFRAAFVAPGDVVFVHLRWSVVEGSKQATDPCEGRTWYQHGSMEGARSFLGEGEGVVLLMVQKSCTRW